MALKFKYKAIAAMAKNRVIGNNGAIPWYIPEDFKWFKQNTIGQTLLMGRKTYESIGRPLPERQTLILSRSSYIAENTITVSDMDSIEKSAENETIWVAGGAEIYKLMLPHCDDLYLTRVNAVHEGDTLFPEFEKDFKLNSIIDNKKLFSIEHWIR